LLFGPPSESPTIGGAPSEQAHTPASDRHSAQAALQEIRPRDTVLTTI